MPVVLVVEDDRSTLESLARGLRLKGFEVLTAAGAEEALTRLSLTPVDVVVSDVMMEGLNGMELLARLKERYEGVEVILVTAYGTIESAVEAVQLGAFDYLTKPINLTRLVLLIKRAVSRQQLVRENQALRERLHRQSGVDEIIGDSAALRVALRQVDQIAATSASVLILGESGTGKELVARAIHARSPRGDQPFVVVNCVALAEGLIESELFGHDRGAFTGAHTSRQGRFEQANGGTLFLDEVGDLQIPTQLKLLRAIQEREIERVGGQSTIPVDVRLVAATNRDLEQGMAQGEFREELYYRLKVVTLHLPALRDRPEDIRPLADHFLRLFCARHGRGQLRLTDAALELLVAHRWPGNVRELRNVVESAVVTCQGDEITEAHLPFGKEDGPPPVVMPIGRTLAAVERTYLLRTLEAMHHNKARTAQVLGIAKKTLYNRLAAYREGIVGSSGGRTDKAAPRPGQSRESS